MHTHARMERGYCKTLPRDNEVKNFPCFHPLARALGEWWIHSSPSLRARMSHTQDPGCLMPRTQDVPCPGPRTQDVPCPEHRMSHTQDPERPMPKNRSCLSQLQMEEPVCSSCALICSDPHELGGTHSLGAGRLPLLCLPSSISILPETPRNSS